MTREFMFKIIKNSKISKARLSQIGLSAGKLNAPFFMPDATRAVLKNIDFEILEKLGLKHRLLILIIYYCSPVWK